MFLPESRLLIQYKQDICEILNLYFGFCKAIVMLVNTAMCTIMKAFRELYEIN